ncbi:hypothetical protein [Pseudomonas asiatica]|uniref:Y-family DNA polymerase n=1 Tax=Pseudomonas asiatica TaxID=2219225 RepID=UPI003D9EDC49
MGWWSWAPPERQRIQPSSKAFHLNGDMSERVMTILEGCFPSIEVYSIDEAFADMTGLPEPLESIGRQVQAEIRQKTGIPVGIGIATGVFQDSCRVDRVFRPPFSAAVVPAPARG